MKDRMTADEFKALQRQPKDWGGKEPPAIRDMETGEWRFLRDPKSEKDVERACLQIANWYMWVKITDLIPRAHERLGKEATQRAVRIALEECKVRGLSGVWLLTSWNGKARNDTGTPDIHFYGVDGSVTAIEFKGPDTRVGVGQAFLAAIGASTIIGPDDLMKFKQTIGGK